MEKVTRTPSSFSRAGGLSAFYGTVLVLLGLVIPMTEALRRSWLSNDFVAVFVTYLYTGASAFIAYLLVQEAILKKEYLRQQQEENDTDDSIQDDDEFCPSVNYVSPRESYVQASSRRRRGLDNVANSHSSMASSDEAPSSNSSVSSSNNNKHHQVSVADDETEKKDEDIDGKEENDGGVENNSLNDKGGEDSRDALIPLGDDVSKTAKVTFVDSDDEPKDKTSDDTLAMLMESPGTERRCNGQTPQLDGAPPYKRQNDTRISIPAPLADVDSDSGSTETSSAEGGAKNGELRRRSGVTFQDPSAAPRKRSSEVGFSKLASRRFSSVRPRSGTVDQAPDDVYNYIAMHMGTATLVNEGTSTFLKGGSLIFAMANVVYVALRIEGDHKRMSECNVRVIIYPHYMHLVFIILQTFFLLKECNFVLRQKKAISSFGLAHLVATNLCVWLRFLMIEVVESLEHRHHAKALEHHSGSSSHGNSHGSGHGSGSDHGYGYGDHHGNLTAGIGYNQTTYHDDPVTCDVQPISVKAGPYLFPFVLEYSLVAMSACIFLFTSINIRVSKEMYRKVLKALTRRKSSGSHYYPHRRSLSLGGDGDDEDSLHGDAADHIPCFKSHKGLFLGVLVMSGTVISMVMFFYFNEEHQHDQANLCYTISESILLLFLLVATVLGTLQISQFVVDLNQSNTFDHVLLLLSVSLYVILELFQVFSAVWYFQEKEVNAVSVMTFIVCVLALVQGAAQAVFLLDGMQRVAVLGHHKRNKYGRGVITFLTVANVAAWVFKSFQEKASDSEPEYEYYGEVAWTIIRSLALPLVLFFRFHSSICLAHMWHHCYQSKVDDIMETQILI